MNMITVTITDPKYFVPLGIIVDAHHPGLGVFYMIGISPWIPSNKQNASWRSYTGKLLFLRLQIPL